MHRQGVLLKDVADILGHASIDTTAIYTKIDIEELRSVSLPWPGRAVPMKHNALMKDLVEKYIQFKIDLGYKLKIEGRLLRNFARFADEIGHHGSLTTDPMLRWATLPSKSARLYQARRLEIVRCFAKYRSTFDPRTEIPGRNSCAH